MASKNPPHPNHVAGVGKGEELATKKGREPGRKSGRESYRTARDSTGINADARKPIHPDSPEIPPA